MTLRRKEGRDFLLGILAGAIGLAALWQFHPEWHDDGSAALDAAWQRRELLRSAAQAVAAPSAATPSTGAQQAPGFFSPVLPATADVLALDAQPATADVLALDAQPASADGVAWTDPVPLASADEPELPGAASLVREDPELAQLDSDLGRLRAQAESVTSHPAALQREVARARARRDACGDRACLLQWYARRRAELLAAF